MMNYSLSFNVNNLKLFIKQLQVINTINCLVICFENNNNFIHLINCSVDFISI